MRIIKQNSLAIVIDIQERLFPHMQDSGTLEKNSIKAINGLNALEVPIWLTQQYTRG